MSSAMPLVAPLERALYLRSVDLFRDLPPHELATLAQLMREAWVRRGTALYSAGGHVHTAHVLVEGRVRYERNGSLVRRLDAPGAVGLLEVLAQDVARVRAVAETNLLALAIDGSAFLDVIEDHSATFLHVRRALGRLVQAQRRRLGVEATWRPPVVTDVGPAPASPPVATTAPSLALVEQLIWLHRSPELRPFGVGLLAAMIRDHGAVRFEAGATLWEEGGEPEFFAVVVDGVVVCGSPETSRAFRAGVGTVVGLESAFCGMPHDHRAVAETPVVAIRIDVPTLLDIAEDEFDVAERMLAYGARLLLRLQDRDGPGARGDRVGA